MELLLLEEIEKEINYQVVRKVRATHILLNRRITIFLFIERTRLH